VRDYETSSLIITWIMRPFFALIILFAWPLAEIAGFVVVGRALGLWWTLALVVMTGLLGAFLLRQQGLYLLKKLSEESQQGHIPAGSVVNGAMIVVAGILLLLPGFLTDIVGIALFIPFVRQALWSAIGKRFVVVGRQGKGGFKQPAGASARDTSPQSATSVGKVVDLDEDDFHRDSDTKSSSPWAKDGDQ
jgi:UPF0716 protein FxsA